MPRVIKLKDGTKYRMKTDLTPISRLRKPNDKDKRDENTAIAYARWIAKRDRIELPFNGTPRVEWTNVYDTNSKGRKITPLRAKAVHWQTMKHTKDGEHHYAVTIEIPNWDYVPVILDESELQSFLIDLSAHLSL